MNARDGLPLRNRGILYVGRWSQMTEVKTGIITVYRSLHHEGTPKANSKKKCTKVGRGRVLFISVFNATKGSLPCSYCLGFTVSRTRTGAPTT